MRLLKTSFLAIAAVCTISAAHAFPAKFGLGPDNSQELLLSTLRSARSSVIINIYQFDNKAISTALLDVIRDKKVRVEILLEGEPLGNISTDGKAVVTALRRELSKGNRGNHFFLMTKAKGERRYRYNHAKYVIVDGHSTLIASENFTDNGHTAPGTTGNRGWEVVLDDKAFAGKMLKVFREDADVGAGDVVELRSGDRLPPLPLSAPALTSLGFASRVDAQTRRQVPAIAQGEGQVKTAELITSPDSLDGLNEFANSARRSLEVQHMSLPSQWKETGNVVYQNPLVADVIAAAKRHAVVRVLLNDDRVFEGGAGQPFDPDRKPKANEITARLLEDVRRCYGYPISARIIDVKAAGITYIHNKGMIADGERAFVSSINGTRNSVMNNREVAVRLESRDAAAYFTRAFDFDWEVTPTLDEMIRPGVMLNERNCPSNPMPFLNALGF